MEKYHTIVKIERVRKELQLGNFSQAFAFASKINTKRLTSMADFSLLAEAFFHAKEYKKANEYYLLIYNSTKSKRALSQLVHVSIKLNEIEAANDYLKEYEKCAPGDFNRYIYRYYLNQLEGRALEESASLLEDLKEVEYIDHWVYELAKIYHKMGQKAKCIKECDDLILWFGQGKYVQRAKALKAYYTGALDVTLAGQDAAMFAKEMQRVLGPEVKEKRLQKGLNIRTEENDRIADEDTQITEGNDRIARRNTQITEGNDRIARKNNRITEEYDPIIGGDNVTTEEMGLEVKSNDTAVSQLREDGIGFEDDNSEDYLLHDITKNLVASVAEFGASFADDFDQKEEGDHDKTFDNLDKKAEKLSEEEQDYQNKPLKARNKHKKKEASNSSMLKMAEVEATISRLLEEEEREHKERIVREKKDQNGELKEQINEQSIIKIKSITDDDLRIDKKTQLWNVLNNKGIILTDIMGTFLQIDSIQKQVIDSLEHICKEFLTKAEFILTAEKESSSHLLMFAKALAKVLHRMGVVKSGKIALIRAEKLNQIDFEKKKEITESCLIIESAGDLEEKTITKLLQLCKNNQGSMAVILMDMSSNITDILNNKVLCKIFKHQIHLPDYSVLEWKNFIYEIIKANDYNIHEQADALLDKKIEEILRKDDTNVWDEMIALTQQVIQNAEKRNGELLHKLSTTNEFNSTQLMIIMDSDCQ